MSLPNEALHKLVREIESQAATAQQQVALARSQQASKQRELRMAQLTLSEISALPAETGVYEGVGKMFVALPASAMTGKLQEQIAQTHKEVATLDQRLHSLEMTQKNSKDHIDRILGGGGTAA